MALVNVLDITGEKKSEVDLPDTIFNVPVKSSVLHEVVTMQLARRRSGTACVKNRSDIKGSTKKLFRQKGTGRARRGNIKSPLLKGGGVVFGPHPRSYDQRIPKKVRRLALKMALSSKFQGENLVVLDSFPMERIKTRDFVDVLEKLDTGNVLIIVDQKDETLILSSRNVPKAKVMVVDGLNVYDVLKYEKLILLQPSIEKIEGRLLA